MNLKVVYKDGAESIVPVSTSHVVSVDDEVLTRVATFSLADVESFALVGDAPPKRSRKKPAEAA